MQELLAEKAQREKRRFVPLTEVRDATGITWSTLQSWSNNDVNRIDVRVIDALLVYFDKQDLGDLLVYIPSAPQEPTDAESPIPQKT
jgi:hypothetical protein